MVGGTPKLVATDEFPYGYPLEVVRELLTRFQKSYSWGLKAVLKTIFPEPGTDYVKEWGFRLSQKTTKEIIANVLSNFLKEDIRPLLGKIDIPTLITHGENDKMCPLVGARYMHEKIPRSEMYVFEDKGHAPSITAADKFNKILEEFITTGKLLKD